MEENREFDLSKLPVGMQLKSVNNLIRRNLDMMFASIGASELSGMQGPMVDYIFKNSSDRDVFQKDIEKNFNIRRSTATVMLQNLESKGYIVRVPVEHDGRLKKIVLTPKAVESNLAIRKQLDSFNERLERGLTDKDKAHLVLLLNKIKTNLEIK